MLRGIAPASQPLRRLELVLATCQQLGIKAVVPSSKCERTMAICQQIGYELALQEITADVPSSHQHLAAAGSSH